MVMVKTKTSQITIIKKTTKKRTFMYIKRTNKKTFDRNDKDERTEGGSVLIRCHVM